MFKKLTALLAALTVGLTALAPADADARDRRGRGYYERHYYDDYDRRGRWRHHDDDDDEEAIVAGVAGLVLGLAIGSLASQPRDRRVRCYDNYQRCPPPDRYYHDGYYDRRSAYERDYGYAPPPPPRDYYDEPRCVRQERQWDRYAGRYVIVDVPC